MNGITLPPWRINHEKAGQLRHSPRTDSDYRAAFALVAPYFDNEPEIDSDAGAHFGVMVTLIEAYEAKHYPMSPPDPLRYTKVQNSL